MDGTTTIKYSKPEGLSKPEKETSAQMGEPAGAKEASITVTKSGDVVPGNENYLSPRCELDVDPYRERIRISVVFKDLPEWRFTIIGSETKCIQLVPIQSLQVKGRQQWRS
jgi:hypothetical protein